MKTTHNVDPHINRLTTSDFLRATAEYKLQALGSCLIPFSSLLLNTGLPYFIGHTLSALSQHAATHSYVIGLIIVAFIGVLFNYIGFISHFSVQPRVMAALDKAALQSLLERSAGYHNNTISGKVVTDTVNYSTAYQKLSNIFLIDTSGFILNMVLGIIIVSITSWQLGLLVLVMTVLVVGVVLWQTLSTSDNRRQRHEARRTMVAHLSDTVVNNQTVKTFANETTELQMHDELGGALQAHRVRDWTRIAKQGSARISFMLLFQLSFVLLIIHLVARDPTLLGVGIFTFAYAINLGNRLFDVGTTVLNIEDSYYEASDITRLRHTPLEVKDAPRAQKLHVKDGIVDFKQVNFAYNDNSANEAVFENLNLTIQKGERVGLVGQSGGGKSTLTKLLLRFDDIQSGEITIDNQDIAQVTQESLRQAIAYVPQEPLLFHRSISDNIAYGKTSATQIEIIDAAKKAFAHDFIEELPHDYDTLVGERGVKLSGGQRQRIAIARAMLKNAPILLLDEATSALDSESEALIQDALWKLMEGRTAIVIAHRLSTIQKMDRIIVLDEGQIIEQGSHKDLLKKKGTYAKLWARQSGGFMED